MHEDGATHRQVLLVRERAMMPRLVYALVLAVTLVTSSAVAQLPQDATVSKIQTLAEQGNAIAQFTLGLAFDNGRPGIPPNYTEALTWYRRAADQGLDLAQLYLGHMYDYGKGGPPNYTEALTWYRCAAEQGLSSAQYNLGLMYAKGDGVPQNYAEAVQWLRRATEQGLAEAQGALGLMYALGHGVPQDNVQAQ